MGRDVVRGTGQLRRLRGRAGARARRASPRPVAPGPRAGVEVVKRSAHGHHLLDVPAKPDPRAATPPVGSVTVDVRSLEHALRRSTEAEIRFTDGDRAI